MSERELPPVISILLQESPPPTDVPGMKRWYRRLSPELRRQARWTSEEFEYAAPPPVATGLLAVPSGGIDPCRSVGVCGNLPCRLKAARQFARTLGLYSDHVVVADELSPRLAFRTRFSPNDIQQLAVDALVVHELRPLIDAGVISFQELYKGYCKVCFHKFTSNINAATSVIVDELHINPKPTLIGDSIMFSAEEIYGYPIMHWQRLDAPTLQSWSSRKTREQVIRAAIRTIAERLVRDAAMNLNEAASIGGTLLSGSRVSMLAVQQLERSGYLESDAGAWEASRSIHIPWVRDLSVSDIVNLRDLAADALPRLRERLGGALRDQPSSEQQINECIRNLREEALEVQEELKAIRTKHETIFRNVTGVLGLVIAIYGFGSGFIPAAPALGSLMTLLGLLHASDQKEHAEAHRVRSRPAYVLVKARELLDHAENGGG